MPNIISASRRTDIPAFYSEWFMNRISDGYVYSYNPFNNRLSYVSLKPKDVSAIVFWSKNYAPLMRHMDELDRLGYRTIFHFTITGLSNILEDNVIPVDKAIEIFNTLSERYSSRRVFWRFDPVVFTNKTGPEFYLRKFDYIASKLSGKVETCYISFVNTYNKVKAEFNRLTKKDGIIYLNPPEKYKKEFADELAEHAQKFGISLYACCNDYLVDGKVQKAHCIDAQYISQIFDTDLSYIKPNPTREGCVCSKSVDIGVYNTCMHGCHYCYANDYSRRCEIKANWGKNQKEYPFLIKDEKYVIEKNKESGAEQLTFLK